MKHGKNKRKFSGGTNTQLEPVYQKTKTNQSIKSKTERIDYNDEDDSTSKPSWISNYPLSLSMSVFGNCPNVSSRYEKLGRIGEGTYGVVYRARDRMTRDIVALKRCLPHHEASDGFPLTTLREITLLRELQTERDTHGIVALKDVAVSSSRSGVFLVFEYAEHDLATLVDTHYTQHKCSPFRESEAKRIILQLLEALKFLHSRHIIHRDLKLSNLLYNYRGELKVADFGLARRVGGIAVNKDDEDWQSRRNSCSQSCLTPKVVSLWYRPPELLLGAENYDQGVDNWGAGCVMGELLRGKPLMDGRNEMDQLQKMFDLLGPPNEDRWPGLNDMPLLRKKSIEIPTHRHTKTGQHVLDVFRKWRSSSGIRLLTGLLEYNPKTRLTATDALSSNYFSELPAPTPLSLMPTFPTKNGI